MVYLMTLVTFILSIRDLFRVKDKWQHCFKQRNSKKCDFITYTVYSCHNKLFISAITFSLIFMDQDSVQSWYFFYSPMFFVGLKNVVSPTEQAEVKPTLFTANFIFMYSLIHAIGIIRSNSTVT